MLTPVKVTIQGLIKITDLETGAVLRETENAANPEAMSLILATMLQGNNSQYVYELHLGNGGTVIDETGNITYKDVTENLSLGTVADLYNPVFYRVVDTLDEINNPDITRNYVAVNHLDGLPYTDLVLVCTLDEEDPVDFSGELIFNEIGIKSKGSSGLNSGFLLTHATFEPVVKNTNRAIQIEYTLRIRS
jgi:hypothetical protein